MDTDAEDFSTPHAVQYKRLIDLYGIPAERRGGWLVEMAETFDAYPEAALERAVNRYRKDYKPFPGAYVQAPPPGTLAAWVYQAADDLEAEATGSRTPSDDLTLPAPTVVAALPAPNDTPEPEPPAVRPWVTEPGRLPAGPSRAAWEWNLAIGTARAQKRQTLIQAWRRTQGGEHDWQSSAPESAWKGRDEPTETEVRFVVDAVREQTQSAIAQAEMARSNARRGRGRMRFEWADGEVSDVTMKPLGKQ